MERLFDIHEAAEQLRLSPETLRKWVRVGRISCVRVGDRVLFTPTDIQSVMVRSEPRSLSAVIANVLQQLEAAKSQEIEVRA